MSKSEIWNQFCSKSNVFSESVPLFKEDSGTVKTFSYGKYERLILKRSEEMETLLGTQVELLIKDFESASNDYEGIIYMMLWKN